MVQSRRGDALAAWVASSREVGQRVAVMRGLQLGLLLVCGCASVRGSRRVTVPVRPLPAVQLDEQGCPVLAPFTTTTLGNLAPPEPGASYPLEFSVLGVDRLAALADLIAARTPGATAFLDETGHLGSLATVNLPCELLRTLDSPEAAPARLAFAQTLAAANADVLEGPPTASVKEVRVGRTPNGTRFLAVDFRPLWLERRVREYHREALPEEQLWRAVPASVGVVDLECASSHGGGGCVDRFEGKVRLPVERAGSLVRKILTAHYPDRLEVRLVAEVQLRFPIPVPPGLPAPRHPQYSPSLDSLVDLVTGDDVSAIRAEAPVGTWPL